MFRFTYTIIRQLSAYAIDSTVATYVAICSHSTADNFK